jgi:hypothetical protein
MSTWLVPTPTGCRSNLLPQPTTPATWTPCSTVCRRAHAFVAAFGLRAFPCMFGAHGARGARLRSCRETQTNPHTRPARLLRQGTPRNLVSFLVNSSAMARGTDKSARVAARRRGGTPRGAAEPGGSKARPRDRNRGTARLFSYLYFEPELVAGTGALLFVGQSSRARGGSASPRFWRLLGTNTASTRIPFTRSRESLRRPSPAASRTAAAPRGRISAAPPSPACPASQAASPSSAHGDLRSPLVAARGGRADRGHCCWGPACRSGRGLPGWCKRLLAANVRGGPHRRCQGGRRARRSAGAPMLLWPLLGCWLSLACVVHEARAARACGRAENHRQTPTSARLGARSASASASYARGLLAPTFPTRRATTLNSPSSERRTGGSRSHAKLP